MKHYQVHYFENGRFTQSVTMFTRADADRLVQSETEFYATDPAPGLTETFEVHETQHTDNCAVCENLQSDFFIPDAIELVSEALNEEQSDEERANLNAQLETYLALDRDAPAYDYRPIDPALLTEDEQKFAASLINRFTGSPVLATKDNLQYRYRGIFTYVYKLADKPGVLTEDGRALLKSVQAKLTA